MSLGLLLIILNYYFILYLKKKEYDVNFFCALRGSTTSNKLLQWPILPENSYFILKTRTQKQRQ